MTSATSAMQEEKKALVFLSECLYKVTACLLGPRWASLCGAQAAQGLLCEARKFFSSPKMTLRSPQDPCWYRHVLAKFCAKHNLPLTVCAASSAMHCSAPDVPATMDPVVLNKLLDLFQALVWRFCTEFCNASGVDIPLRPGAQGILQTPQFRRRKLLQFNWRVDRASLCMWEACHPHIGVQTAEWPHPAVVDGRGDHDGHGPLAVRDVVQTTAAHVLLPCRQLVFLTRDTISNHLEEAFADAKPMRHPYGRAVDQAVKLVPKLERFEALSRK
jgi:hypothetical protein